MLSIARSESQFLFMQMHLTLHSFFILFGHCAVFFASILGIVSFSAPLVGSLKIYLVKLSVVIAKKNVFIFYRYCIDIVSMQIYCIDAIFCVVLVTLCTS